MSYAGKYASRNASAARDWAADRQAKIQRAKELREERKRAAGEDCTFAPQKVAQYEPQTGSSRMGNVSEYSQEYLRDFHFAPAREEEQSPRGGAQPVYSLSRKPSHGSMGSADSIGPGQSPHKSRRGTGFNQAGQMIASNGQYMQHNQQQQQGPPPYYHAPADGHAPRHHHPYEQQQQQRSQHVPSYGNQHGPAGQWGSQQPQQPRQPQQPQPQQQQQPSNNHNEGYHVDALSSEMRRHGADDNDACDMSYEFAASSSHSRNAQFHRSSERRYDHHVEPQQQQQQQQHQQQHQQHHQHQQHQQQQQHAQREQTAEYEGENSDTSGRLSLIKNRGSRIRSATRQHTAPAGPAEDSDSGRRGNRIASAQARLHQSGACTRQSGCQCAQCNQHSSFAPETAPSRPARPGRRASKLDKRPPWNSDFVEGDTATLEAEADTGMTNLGGGPTARVKRSAAAQRPSWRGVAEDDGDGDGDTQVGAQGQGHRVQDMREELRGGKADFMEQMHGDHAGSSHQAGMAGGNRPQRARAPAQPKGQPKNDIRPGFRGMYVPPPESDYGAHGDDGHDAQQSDWREPEVAPRRSAQAHEYQAPPSNPDEQVIPAIGGGGSSGGNGMDHVPEYAPVGPLHPCDSCGRKFGEQALRKHLKVCKKVFQTKRKAFDTKKARLKEVLQNPEDARVVKSSLRGAGGGAGAKGKKGKGGKWKQQSAALREAMKYNKMLTEAKEAGKDLASLPPPPESTNHDFVPCPTCGRTFNERAAERHIPRCKDQKAKPNRLVRGGGTNASNRTRR